MIEIKKEFNFNIAHLTNKNLHGHSYRLIVMAKTIFETGEKKVVNFNELNEFVEKNILSSLSNTFLYNKNGHDICEKEIAKVLNQNGRKTLALDFVPTTEKLADYIYKSLNFDSVMQEKDFRISKVELYESNQNCAIVTT